MTCVPELPPEPLPSVPLGALSFLQMTPGQPQRSIGMGVSGSTTKSCPSTVWIEACMRKRGRGRYRGEEKGGTGGMEGGGGGQEKEEILRKGRKATGEGENWIRDKDGS